nr:MAG TPA: hypothetical protein [Caudoviricetes sp.]
MNSFFYFLYHFLTLLSLHYYCTLLSCTCQQYSTLFLNIFSLYLFISMQL